MVTRRSVLMGVAGLPLCAGLLSSRVYAQSAPSGFNYYISPTGSDSNSGTSASPWAITSLTPGSKNYANIAGHTIGLLPGTYDVSAFPVSAYTTKLTIPPGTASAPTVIQSVTPRAAILVCDPATSGYIGGGAVIGNGCNGVGMTTTPEYITIDGLTIVGGTTAPTSPMCGVSFAGSAPETCQGLVIQNCEIYNFLNPSGAINIGLIVFGTGPVGAIVRNCELHDCYTVGVPRNSHDNSSGVHDYSNLVTVENCTIYGCNNGIYQKNQNVTPPPDGMTIRNCYFYAGAGMGPALAGFNNAFGTTPPYRPLNVYNNVFEGMSGIYYNANDGVEGLQASTNFYNNTVYLTQATCLGIWLPTAAAYTAGVRVSIYNNILAGGSTDPSHGAVTLGPTYGAWAVCNYNNYPSNPEFGVTTADNIYPTSLLSLASWRAVAGLPDAQSLDGDPGFVGSITAGSGASQYQLSASSPCRSAGRVTGVSTGANIDMGAWGGTSSIGCDFASTTADPSSPLLINVT